MRFSTFTSLAFATLATFVSAQASTKANAITEPIAGTTITAGSKYDIKWMNTVGSTVTLVIVDGPPGQVHPVATIVPNAPNTGSYSWDVPKELAMSNSYSIRIQYDNNPNNWNYSDRFVLSSSVPSIAVTSSAVSTAVVTTVTSASSPSSIISMTSTVVTSTATSTALISSTDTSSVSRTSMSTSTTKRPTSSSASPSTSATGAPPSAGNNVLSSPIAIIMTFIAAALFLH